MASTSQRGYCWSVPSAEVGKVVSVGSNLVVSFPENIHNFGWMIPAIWLLWEKCQMLCVRSSANQLARKAHVSCVSTCFKTNIRSVVCFIFFSEIELELIYFEHIFGTHFYHAWSSDKSMRLKSCPGIRCRSSEMSQWDVTVGLEHF